MALYVVIDTNVLVSSIISKKDDAATVQVLESFFSGKIIPLYNSEIIFEYYTVLHREKFHLQKDLVNQLIATIISNGMQVDKVISGEILPDPKDLVFYEVTLSEREHDSFLVTGNLKHFPIKNFIVIPKDLMNIINATL